MGKIGYYRYKINNLTKEELEQLVQQGNARLTPQGYELTYNWTVNDEVVCTSKVIVKPKCDDSIYVKYLDKYGMYRFILFNHYWSRMEQTDSLGDVESANTYGEISSIGSNLSEVYTLTAEQVTPEELAIYGDIFSSPNIYMKLPDGDWKAVMITGGDGINRRNRAYNSKFTIQVTDKNVTTITK